MKQMNGVSYNCIDYIIGNIFCTHLFDQFHNRVTLLGRSSVNWFGHLCFLGHIRLHLLYAAA